MDHVAKLNIRIQHITEAIKKSLHRIYPIQTKKIL